MEQPGPSSLSPRKGNHKGKRILSRQKRMVINSYKQLEQEHPYMKYKPMIKYLSEKLGIGHLFVMNTLAEYERAGSVTSPNQNGPRLSIKEKTSDEDMNAIRKKVYEFWFRREAPNMKKVLQAVNEDPQLPYFNESTLYRLLKRMQFKFIVRAENTTMFDQDYIVLWRRKYIEDIKKYQAEGRQIYYLDETWIDRRISDQTSTEKRLMVAHIGSSNGFVPGALQSFEDKKGSCDFHNEMTWETFYKWFSTVLPTLKAGSVIVMDNAPYHSKRLVEYPKMSWTKTKIMAWLVAKGETVSVESVKVSLIELVQKYKNPQRRYLIDEHAKLHGYTILRLPPYHSQFNPSELAWAMIKDYIKTRNTTNKLADVKNLLVEAIGNVTAENWQNFIRHTTEEEKKYQQLDHIVDDILDETAGWKTDESDLWISSGEEDDDDET